VWYNPAKLDQNGKDPDGSHMTSFSSIPPSELLTSRSVVEFLDALASASPTPGGGSASALAGALAAALIAMVCRLTLGRASFAAVAPRMQGTLSEAELLRRRLAEAVDDDAGAYEAVMAAYKRPRGSEEEKAARSAAVQSALKGATQVPLQVAADCVQLLGMARFVAESGNPNAASDGDVAVLLAGVGARGAIRNVEINLSGIRDSRFTEQIGAQLKGLLIALDEEVRSP